MTEHLSEVTAARFVDGSLSRRERAVAEQHLSDCAECRTEIAEVMAMQRPRRRMSLVLTPLATAAAVVLIVIGTNGRERPGTDAELLRSGGANAGVSTTAPLDGQTLPATGSFGWHSVNHALQYRITVTNAAGDVVAEKVTADTTALLDLARGQSFQWYVTAMLRDGSVVSSAIAGFRTQ